MDLAPQQVLAGTYRLAALLGEGTYSWVWLASDIRSGEPYALKIAKSDEAIETLRRQAETPRHAGIVEVHGLHEESSPFFLVMEYVDGANLRDVLGDRRRGIKFRMALRLFRQLCRAVAHAHGCGVIHGDLKPENVLISRERRLKVTDFGVVRSFEDASIRHSLATRINPAPFTPLYLAPELRGGTRRATESSDVYALGIIFHEMLTGRPPEGADPPSAVRPSLPDWVDDVFRAAYTGAERRLRDAGDLLEALDTAERKSRLASGRHGPPPLPGDGQKRRFRGSRSADDLPIPKRRPNRPQTVSQPTPASVIVGFVLSVLPCCWPIGLILCLYGRDEAIERDRGVTMANIGIGVSLFYLLMSILSAM